MPRAACKPRLVWIGALALVGCLEPNPYADGGDTGTSTSNTSTSNTSAGTDTGTPPPSDFAYEVLAFEAGPDGFSGSLAKPDQPNVVALAVIDDYSPRNAQALGYAVELTDNGGSYDVSVTIDGADNNSRVRGRAIALGFAAAPQLETIELTGPGDCASQLVAGPATVDAVQAYGPNGGVELSYARTATASGDGVTVEYCITAASDPGASLRVALLGFSPPDGVSAHAADDVVIDSQTPQAISFPQIDAAAEVLHLVSAHALDEAAANDLGYTIACASTAPFACSVDLSGFAPGVQVRAGGLTIAVP
jgi:hypothetical protein